MIAIVDYGVGNLFSLKCSFDAIGTEAVVTDDPEVIEQSDRIILPGVGAFEDAAKKLKESGLKDVLLSEAVKDKPLMGICLGMQLLFETSYEYGVHQGLGLIPGEIIPISKVIPKDYKIPHIGWNALKITKPTPLFKYIQPGQHVYFVHSYYAANCGEHTIATAEYGADLTAAVAKDHVYGCQFHPEKSGDVGLKILKAFTEV